MTREYLGLDKDAWGLLFSAFNSLMVLVGVMFGLRTLRQSVRQQLNASLTKLLDEYRSASFRDSVRHTIKNFPIFAGPLEDRLHAFLDYGRRELDKEDLEQARAVIHKLNDLGAFIDRRGVREEDFYGHTYPRLLELKARLEPLVISVSALKGFRWGMRIRRMGRGAQAYYSSSKLHSNRPFVIDGVTVVEPGRSAWHRRFRQRLRNFVGHHSYTPRATQMVDEDEHDLAICESLLAQFDDKELDFLSYAV